MPSPTALIHPALFPANVRPHLRVQLRLAANLVPYPHVAVVLTNREGYPL